MSDLSHELDVAARAATIVRQPQRITNDRAKALVAAGIQRASLTSSLDSLALAGGCSKRCVEKSLSHETLPGIDKLGNMLTADPTILDEFFAALGFRLAGLHSDPAGDFATLAALCDAGGEFSRALADGSRNHSETLRVAEKLRPLLPALIAIVREADGLRGHT